MEWVCRPKETENLAEGHGIQLNEEVKGSGMAFKVKKM